MKSFTTNQWLGIVLILAALLIWAPLEIIPQRQTIGAIVVVGIGIYQLFK